MRSRWIIQGRARSPGAPGGGIQGRARSPGAPGGGGFGETALPSPSARIEVFGIKAFLVPIFLKQLPKCDTAFQVDDFTGKNLSGSFKPKAFAWPLVELSRNGVVWKTGTTLDAQDIHVPGIKRARLLDKVNTSVSLGIMDIHHELSPRTEWHYVRMERKEKSADQSDGITFEQAVTVFFDPFLQWADDASRHDEARKALVGFDTWYRLPFVAPGGQDEEAIRIISARKATQEERRSHEHS